jgi:two-component system cell cycle sensor histidine kinase/response regulator CckA
MKLGTPQPTSAKDESASCPVGQQTAGKGLILVVDDEPMVRTVARRILERNGYSVQIACDGKEGSELFEIHHPRISAVLLDMAMPVMDGEQAFHAMRAGKPVVPVVFSSGFIAPDAIERLLKEPATAFVGKPYLPSRLLDVLDGLIGDGTPSQPRHE